MLLQKDFIMDTYVKYDWLDLLNITRSCEGNFENLNFKNYDHGITPLEVCGKCFGVPKDSGLGRKQYENHLGRIRIKNRLR